MLRILLFIGFIVATIEDYVYYPEVKQSYMFYRTPQMWFDARNTCRGENATLAMPKNEAEVLVLKKIFDGLPKSTLENNKNPRVILLGFHDMFKEEEYLTDEGESIQNYFHTWGNNQPDNDNNEDCGSLFRSGVLNDYSCNIPAAFICQKNKREVKNLASSRCSSSDPAYEYSNQTDKCYKLHLNPKTWPVARLICKAEGGNLAIINSKTEEDLLVAMFKNPQNKFNYVGDKNNALIGFHDIFREGHFITVEGNELKSTGYIRWKSGEPNNDNNNENCGSMHVSGGLNDFPCDLPAFFFCEIESNPYRPSNMYFST